MTLAYFDGLRSLVPVKVVSIEPRPFGEFGIKAKVTAERGGYKRGDVICSTGRNIFPRVALYKRRGGSYRILPYNWNDWL